MLGLPPSSFYYQPVAADPLTLELMNAIDRIYPRPRPTFPNPQHRVYPYLLRGVTVDRPDQVWCSDITYLPLPSGFVFLVAVMDWFSRYVLAWRVSNTLDAAFCLEVLEEALSQGRPGPG